MADSNYIKIFTGDFIIVQRIVIDLKKESIYPVIKDETESARLAGFGGGIVTESQKVYVHKDHLDRANSILEAIISQLEN